MKDAAVVHRQPDTVLVVRRNCVRGVRPQALRGELPSAALAVVNPPQQVALDVPEGAVGGAHGGLRVEEKLRRRHGERWSRWIQLLHVILVRHQHARYVADDCEAAQGRRSQARHFLEAPASKARQSQVGAHPDLSIGALKQGNGDRRGEAVFAGEQFQSRARVD